MFCHSMTVASLILKKENRRRACFINVMKIQNDEKYGSKLHSLLVCTCLLSLTCELITGQERHGKMLHPAQLSGYGSPQIVPTER